MRALTIRLTKDALLTVRRSKRWKKRMVYILIANKPFKYKSGRKSYVIYIGTTSKGGNRPATSAMEKATEAFDQLHGVKEIKVHLATCKGRKALRTWEYLESALLTTFRDLHYELPKYNKRKGSVKHAEDIDVFRNTALRKIILQFAE